MSQKIYMLVFAMHTYTQAGRATLSPHPPTHPPTHPSRPRLTYCVPAIAAGGGSSFSELPRWQVVTGAVLIPIAAVALVAGAVTIHKKRKENMATASSA